MINGTIVNYYYHCKRQCWLFWNKLNMEDNSENVRIGRVLHELKNEKEPEMIGNIRVDNITKQYIVEIKKSDADLDAATAQLKYYIYCLSKLGINRSGKLECVEKNKQDKKVHIINIDEGEFLLLEQKYKEIELFLETPNPPAISEKKKCPKCAYFEYCNI